MPALNFKRPFAADVKSGKKRQTIRAWRKRPFRIGDTLYLYVDQRSPERRLLGVSVCRMAISFSILELGTLWLDDCDVLPDAAEAIAQNDGFGSAAEMVEWFRSEHGLPFDGQLIMW